MFIFPLLTNMSKILDDWHCNSFNSVDSYDNCINAKSCMMILVIHSLCGWNCDNVLVKVEPCELN